MSFFFEYLLDGETIFYGYGLDRLSDNGIDEDAFISVTDPFIDPYWEDNTYHATDYSLFITFDTSTQAPQATSSPYTYNVPNLTFGGNYHPIATYYATTSGGTQKCRFSGWSFHYGPEILTSNW